METNESERPGVLDTLRRIAAKILAVLQNRLELFLVELQEERIRLCNTLLLAAAVVALGCFTLATATTALVIIFWDAFGIKGLLVACGVGLISTLIGYWRLRVQLKNWRPLANTLAELKKDRECLAGKN